MRLGEISKNELDWILDGQSTACVDLIMSVARTVPGGYVFDRDSEVYQRYLRECAPRVSAEKRKAVVMMKARWARVLPTWREATRYIVAKASKAAASRVSLEQFTARASSCWAPCPHRSYSASRKVHYCGLCMCGDRTDAHLDALGAEPDGPPPQYEGPYTKLHYPYLECPIGARGFSNAEVA